MNTQQAYILSYLKYGENDAILHCFCEEEGFQTYFIKGVYSKKNKKKAYLLPLNKITLYYHQHKTSNMPLATKIELQSSQDIYLDIKASSIVFFISDFLNQILKNENKNLDIFNEINELIKQLDQKNYQSHLIFLLALLKIQGISPLIDKKAYLDPEAGTFSENYSNQFFNETISLLWKSILTSPDPYSIKIPSKERKDLLDSILNYYKYHIPNFKTPISLEIVQQIFE